MSKQNNLDKFHELMFTDIDQLKDLNVVERQQVLRYRYIFTFLLETPSAQDTVLRDALISEYGVSMSQAYRDISNIKIILPNVRNAGKEWIRYIVNEELKKAIADATNQNKLKERIMAITALAKYNKLDQDEAEEMPWDEIVPVSIEPTSDPTVLGIKPMPNRDEEIKKLYEKYKGDIEIEEIEFEDLKNEPSKADIFQ